MGKYDGNRDQVFKNRLLELLERIALALENPMMRIEVDTELTPLEPAEYRDQPILDQAQVCTCGNDPRMACTACSAARMAWIYSLSDDGQRP